MKRPSAIIICPARPQSNNGNWRTARRWSRMLAPWLRITVAERWNGQPFDLMIALHARRSAASIDAWQCARRSGTAAAGAARRALIVVLTGTDLYRDIRIDAAARRSLRQADALVVLQEQGPSALPALLRHKAAVVFQSSPGRSPTDKTSRHLRAVMVGHLRDVKGPQTVFQAARLLLDRGDILIDHVGAPLDAGLARQARATARACPRYRWLGALPHADTLRRIQHAHVLVNASWMEGGAHAVLEALRAGTAVVASRIPGNIGMLGADYAGYFSPGDAAALAVLLRRCRDDAPFLERLLRQCRRRAPLFEPDRERRALARLVAHWLPPRRGFSKG